MIKLLCALCVLAAFVYGQDGELKVEVTHSIESCQRKTQKHDLVTMHYVGKLENGTQFDSRYV